MLEFVVHRGESIARGRRGVVAVAALALAGLVAGCGATEQNAGEPHRSFPVFVTASFPARQRLAEQTNFLIRIKNAGRHAIPDVAVTVLNPRYGAAAQAFGTLLPENGAGQPILASRSRPVWIIDQAPGPCEYSCHSRGPGGAATAYTNTWALGRLAPGHTAVFRWKLTAIQPGAYTVEYEVSAGLNGYARGAARGRFDVHISPAPPQVTVQSDGRVTQRA